MYGLKAQKPLAQGSARKQHALKGQKLLAQGNALGIMSVSNAPCMGKSFKIHRIKMETPLRYVKLLPLQGARFATSKNPGQMNSSSTHSCIVDITQHALKGQKLLAQGIALGIMAISKAPCFTLIEQALSVFFNVNYI